jgi:hypothetical protein
MDAPGRGAAAIGCENPLDLVFARARETRKDGAENRRHSSNHILEPFSASV